jgi:hypothetical protein
MRGIRVRDDAQPLQPGEFRDVDAPGGSLKDAFFILYLIKNHHKHYYN